MNSKLLFIASVFLMTTFMACNSNDQLKASENSKNESAFDQNWAKHFIDSINTKFSEQIAAGDTIALASHYWPDAELLLDNSEPVKGGDIINVWASVIKMGVKEMKFTTTDIAGSLPYIIETGTYEMKDEKKSMLDKGKYVVVWEKRNNEWKLYRDIGCTSLPAAK